MSDRFSSGVESWRTRMNEKHYDISIDRVTEILTELADELPDEIYDNLNLGILVSERIKTSRESAPGLPLYTLGEYKRSPMGRQIIIYYGSFMEAYNHFTERALTERLRSTLHHELLHHLENQGGEFGLEYDDHLRLQEYFSRVRRRNEPMQGNRHRVKNERKDK